MDLQDSHHHHKLLSDDRMQYKYYLLRIGHDVLLVFKAWQMQLMHLQHCRGLEHKQ